MGLMGVQVTLGTPHAAAAVGVVQGMHTPVGQPLGRQRMKVVAAAAKAHTWEQSSLGNWMARPAGRPPKAICHFLGGAFAGAAPQVFYSLLASLLAEEGYLTITTPYQVTFRHIDCARQVSQLFIDTVGSLPAAERSLPVVGVGHSNGALLHLLIGSLFAEPSRANVLLSFNNRQVKEAVPVPLSGLQPALAIARQAPLPFGPLTPSVILSQIESTLPPQLALAPGLLGSATPLLEQISSVLGEVEEGTSEFTPTPEESLALIRSSYSVPSTLLLRFSDDSIDETEKVAAVLLSKFPGQSSRLILPGSHITPCGNDVTWEVGPVFTPVDAVVMGARAVAQVDLRRCAQEAVDWLDGSLAMDGV